MSTLNRTATPITEATLIAGEHVQHKTNNTQQIKTNTQYLDKHDAQRYLPQILREHKAVFEALKNR